jgi:oxygen-independent coproporphyrinogen-3 oxidase
VVKPDILSVDPAQIQRLSKPGPRYTSYPTAPIWSDSVGPAQALEAFDRASQAAEQPLSVYVHLPFCIRRCLFCGCTVEITNQPSRVDQYLAALEREIELVAARLGERRTVSQLHWGGGTPTHLNSAELRRVHGFITKHFVIEPGAEVSIEIHPHVTSSEQIDTLFELGFRRFSMGVQDTDPHVQELIHRDQTVEDTQRCVDQLRALGVEGINLDLMYGLPAQSEATFGATLDTVAQIRPDRLAIYGYAHVPWMKPAQKVLERGEGLPGAVERAHLFSQAVGRLGESGYEVIGIDHFALPTDSLARGLRDGSLSRNFMGYTTTRAEDMLAFGASAIADVGGAFLHNSRETRDYEAALGNGHLATARGMVRSADDDLRRAVIQSLMCRMGVDLDELEGRLGLTGLQHKFASEFERLRPMEAEGLCIIHERKIEVLPHGRLFLRHLAMAFDAYLETNKKDGPQFSQTL